MAKGKTTRPTRAELEILRIFWRLGRSSVRQVCKELPTSPKRSVTTIATLVRVMVDKGLLRKFDEDSRRHQFEANVTELEAGRSMAADIRDRVFNGSLRALIRHAFRGNKPTSDELDEIRKVIDEARKEP